MAATTTSTVLIADRGGFGARQLAASSVAAMWTVKGESTCSVSLPARDLNAFGRDEWLGSWLRWDHPTMGTWGGIVTDLSIEVSDRTAELTASSMHRLLAFRRTPVTYRQATAPAGALALRAIQDADSDAEPWIRTMNADLDGPMISVEWHGEPVADVVAYLAAEGGAEFDLAVAGDWSVAFTMRRQLGRDRTGSVLLVEGRDFGAGQIRRSLEGVANDVLAVANDESWRKSRKRGVVDNDAVDRYGRIQATVPLPGMGTGITLRQQAQAELARSSTPAVPISIDVPARHRHVPTIAHGDTIGLWCPTADRRYAFRVVTRATDSESGMATLSGDAVEVTTADALAVFVAPPIDMSDTSAYGVGIYGAGVYGA